MGLKEYREKEEEIVINPEAPEEKFPKPFKPMLATLTDKPFDDKDWIYEIKWDGYRALAYIKDGNVSLLSRNLNEFTKYKPVVEDLSRIPFNAVIDGEIVVVDKKGYSHFQRLQNLQKKDLPDLRYFVFDLLHLNGKDLRGLPLIERKDLLKKVVDGLSVTRFSDHVENRGIDFFKVAERKNLEGVIAKEKYSKYYKGKRTGDWLKFKVTLRQEAVVGGYTLPGGSRNYFGSLLLGVYNEKGEFEYVGSSGGGFTQKMLKETFNRLKRLEQDKNPFDKPPPSKKDAVWVNPELICEVDFTEWTSGGHMRHPKFIGFREDKPPREIRRELFFKGSGKETKGKGNKGKPKGQAARPVAGDDDQKNYDTENGKGTNRKEAVKGSGEENAASVLNLQKAEKKFLNNPEKIYWPESGYTKKDLFDYYFEIASFILPHLADRPQSLHRHPGGIEGKGFFQKDMYPNPSGWMKTISVESAGKAIHYLLCQDKEDLLNMANLGCIEINPWSSRKGNLDFPDYSVMDIDPADNSFDRVIEVCLAVKEELDAAGVASFPKTSESKGMHIYVPLGAKYTYEQSRVFMQIIAHKVHRKLPKLTSLERSVSARKGKIYLDYLQNGRGKTLASVYCVRPRPGATVSTPLEWEEVRKGLHPSQFTIKTVPARLKEKGDLFSPVLGGRIDLKKAIEKL